MNKEEQKTDSDQRRERMLVPVLGAAAILVSLVAFLLLLYLITIVIRLLFVAG